MSIVDLILGEPGAKSLHFLDESVGPFRILQTLAVGRNHDLTPSPNRSLGRGEDHCHEFYAAISGLSPATRAQNADWGLAEEDCCCVVEGGV
jgi:hypothetical protein